MQHLESFPTAVLAGPATEQWLCRIYGYGGGKLQAGCHAAQSATSAADSTTQRSIPEAAVLRTHELTDCAPLTSAHQGCHEELNPIPLWPLAKSTSAKEESPLAAAAAAAVQDGGNTVAKTAHAMQQLHSMDELHFFGALQAAGEAPQVCCSGAWSNCQSLADDNDGACLLGTGSRADPQSCSAASHSTAERRQSLQRAHELVGRELFITASMLNHSCEPNCTVIRGAGHASIVTQRPIEVCVHSSCQQSWPGLRSDPNEGPILSHMPGHQT